MACSVGLCSPVEAGVDRVLCAHSSRLNRSLQNAIETALGRKRAKTETAGCVNRCMDMCTTTFAACAFGNAPSNGTKPTPCYKPGLVGRMAAKALSWLSTDGGGYLLCVSGGVAGGGVAADGTRAFVSDTHGNVGMMTTIALSGGSVLGASASGGFSFGASNYSSLSGYA